jgi:uncharacterized protein
MAKLTKTKIISQIKKNAKIIREKYDVSKMWIFGSYARGEQTEKSDIDILVEFNGKYDFINELDLQTYLYMMFDKEVGVVEKNHIVKNYRNYILNEHKKVEVLV